MLKKAITKIHNIRKEVGAMFINYFALQVEYGWITIEQVPKKYRKKVKALLEEANKVTDKEAE